MATADTRQISLVPFQGQKRRALQKMVTGADGKEEQRIGYIYMVRTREFKLLGRNVYKIGKTTKSFQEKIVEYMELKKY